MEKIMEFPPTIGNRNQETQETRQTRSNPAFLVKSDNTRNRENDPKNLPKLEEKIVFNDFSLDISIKTSFDETSFQCHKCGFSSPNIVDVMCHKLRQHVETWNYFCNICKINLDFLDILTHVKTHEINEILVSEISVIIDSEPLVQSESDLSESEPLIRKCKKNISKKQQKTVLECKFCDKKFAYKSVFNKHLSNHKKLDENNEFLCDNCGLTFKNKQVYCEHKRRICGIFACPTCKQNFSALKNLKNHFKEIHGGLLAKCRYCTGIFDENELETHCLEFHKEKNIGHFFECDFCQKKFRSKIVLQKHILKHMKQNLVDESFLCMVCGKTFTLESSLKLHLRLHNNDLRYRCDVCGDGFVAKGYLKRHFYKHSGEKPFKCPHCPDAFNHRKAFKKHKELVHQEESQYKCEICSESYETEARFLRHKKIYGLNCAPICRFCNIKVPRGILKRHELTHTDTKLFACGLCPKRFTRKENLDQHQNIHTGERPYKCNVCDQAFHIYATLFAHKLKHEGKQPKNNSKPIKKILQCHQCPFNCNSKNILNSHLLKIHNIKIGIEEIFQCNLCDYTSTKRVNVYAHRRKKHNSKKFDCTYCGKSFTIKFKYVDHMNSHTGATPHACPGCAKSFSSRKNMWQHRDKYCPVVAKRKKALALI